MNLAALSGTHRVPCARCGACAVVLTVPELPKAAALLLPIMLRNLDSLGLGASVAPASAAELARLLDLVCASCDALETAGAHAYSVTVTRSPDHG